MQRYDNVAAAARGRQGSQEWQAARRLLREVLVILTVWLGYELVRAHTRNLPAVAQAHAAALLEWQRRLGFPSEGLVQEAVLDLPDPLRTSVLAALHAVYVYGHFGVTAAALLWLWIEHPSAYRRTRSALFAATLGGLLVAALYPVAPPRLLTGPLHLHRLVDTVAIWAPLGYGGPVVPALVNPYAALPSLHVAWAGVVAGAVMAVGGRRQRALGGVYLGIVVLAVVATGNHYWLDVLAGLALAGGGLLAGRATGPWDGGPARTVTHVQQGARTAAAGLALAILPVAVVFASWPSPPAVTVSRAAQIVESPGQGADAAETAGAAPRIYIIDRPAGPAAIVVEIAAAVCYRVWSGPAGLRASARACPTDPVG